MANRFEEAKNRKKLSSRPSPAMVSGAPQGDRQPSTFGDSSVRRIAGDTQEAGSESSVKKKRKPRTPKPDAERSVKVTLSLPAPIVAELAVVAEKEYRAKSGVVAIALENYFRASKRK